MSRFSEAISEGDGISVIPLLEGDVARLAAEAEAAGAEAVAVATPAEAGRARPATELPVVVRGAEPRAASEAGADACLLSFDPAAGEDDPIAAAYALARELDLDCAVEVRDEDELELVLERVDPEIIVITERDAEREEELERTLDLLPGVPAGKLVVSECRVFAREQVLALERAGVDAILVGADVAGGRDFAGRLAELTGR